MNRENNEYAWKLWMKTLKRVHGVHTDDQKGELYIPYVLILMI